MVLTGESRWRPLSRAVQRRAIRLRTVKGRAATGLFLIEGFRLLAAALEARWPVEAVIVQEKDKTRERLARLLRDHLPTGIDVYTAAPQVVREIAGTVETSGVFALARQKSLVPDGDKLSGRRLLIVDNVREPGNLGAILRSAAAFGLEGVYLSKGTVDVYNPKVVRASMGALFLLPITPDAELTEIGEDLRRQRFTVFVADPHTGRAPNRIGKPLKWALVIGGETEGFSDIWLDYGAKALRIPLSPGVESLNSAVAAGILLYHLGGPRQARARTAARAGKSHRKKGKTA